MTGSQDGSRGLSLDSSFHISDVAHRTPQLVLASASPRRRELLKFLGVAFEVRATDAEEDTTAVPESVISALPPLGLPLMTHPTLLAWRKATAACAEVTNSVIIGADTIVVLDGDVLGKPRDPDHARVMLRRLAGRRHTVYTGLVVVDARECSGAPHPTGGPAFAADLVRSDVVIAELSDSQIDWYVATEEPLDKAGAYGIQGFGGQLVREVHGSYTCVVGLPLVALYHLLAGIGVVGMVDPTEAYRRWLSAIGKESLPCPPTFP